MDDGEIGPKLEVASRGRQRDGAERANVGDRVADRDQVARVPVAARGQHRDPPKGRGAQAHRPGGDGDDRDREGGDRRQEGELRSRGEPGRDPRNGQRRRSDRAPAVSVDRGQPSHHGGRRPRRLRRVPVHEQGRGGQDQGDAGDVVERLAGLELHQALRAERHRRADQRLRPEPVGPADAPGREQGHRQPAQVEHRRDAVAAREQDRDGVQHLGVRGVERGEEDRVEEVDVAEVAGLHEPRRERHVVPEAVGPVHARGERPQGRHHPGGGERGAGEHGDHAGEPPGRWRGGRRGRPHGPAVGQPGGEEARGQARRRPGRRARRPPRTGRRSPAPRRPRSGPPPPAPPRPAARGPPTSPAAAGHAPGGRRRPAPPAPRRARGRRPGTRRP